MTLSPAPQLSLHSPVGDITVTEDEGAIVSLDWGWAGRQTTTPLLDEAVRQLHAYFDGDTEGFSLPLAPAGTAFQQRVWQSMAAIPYGATRTYGALAAGLGTGPRAVGAACGRNPIPIILPCHRVLGAGGRLHGYSGGEGLETKRALLDLERAVDRAIHQGEGP